METIVFPLVIAFLGVVLLPPIARRLRVPVIALELVFGIIIGRSLFDLVPDHEVIEFFSSFGLTYVMFLAGMETDLSRIHRKILKKVLAIAVASVLVPFVCGMAISAWVNINPWLMGTVLCTTSLGLVMPILKELKMTRQMSQMLLVSVVIVDIVSMFVLAFVLAAVQGTLSLSYLYSIIAILVLFLVPWYVNKRKLRRKITRKLFMKRHSEMELRVAFAIIFLFGAVSIELGFHSIIGAFIAGLLISEILPKRFLQEEKLESFGYSFFIPLFFIFTGAKVNLAPVFASLDNITMLLAIVAVGLLSKVIGVAVAARLSNIKMKFSLAFGVFHTARLSLIIAVADIALGLALIDDGHFASFIVLAIVSATAAPTLGRYILERGTEGKKA